MRILVASVRTPFVHGGAEVLASELVKALIAAGHQAELVLVPFNSGDAERIPDQMLASALMPLDVISAVKVDRLIGLKFPAYLIPHPCKVVWLMHQHRPAYDLWENPLGDLRQAPRGRIVRDIIRRADLNVFSATRAVFTLSSNVSGRLRRFCDIESVPLLHPPADPEMFYCADRSEPYIFFPSRITSGKRQELALRALALTRAPVHLQLAGAADTPLYGDQLIRLARDLGVHSRVKWLGFLSQEAKRDLYARAVAVLFPPFDEDYGYVTLEAMLSSKPVITCDDSGGPLEFVIPGKTGLVTRSTPEDLAEAMDAVWEDRARAQQLGRAGRNHYEGLGLSWGKVVKQLLA